MGKIHVGRTLLSNRGLEDALRQAKVGDELHIHEGTYRLDAISLNGIHLIGVGEPEQIVIEARLDVWAHTRISGLTLRAPHFGNAVYLRSEDAYLDLTGVSIAGDPAKKYPTIYGDGGTLVLARSTVGAREGSLGVDLTRSGYLHATDSRVDGMKLIGGRAVLADVTTTMLQGTGGARIEAYNALTVRPPEGYHALAVTGESVATISALHLPEAPASAFCEGSFLQIDSVHGCEDGIRVAVRGRSVVESEDEAVTTYDPDAPPPPKVVTWRVSDAHDFKAAVAPHLRPGDTLRLEEGEYFLQDYPNGALGIAFHVAGAGADRTVLHGSLSILEGHDVSVSDLTIAPGDHNGVLNTVDSALEVTDVKVTSTSEVYPAVHLDAGRTTMRRCTVVVPADSGAGVTHVTGRARLDATSSDLGWVTAADHGSVSLRDCGSHWLAAAGATIASRGTHVVEGNTRSMRQVIAEQSATISLESLTAATPEFEAYAESSTLGIEHLTVPEGGDAEVLAADGARVRVDESAAVTITDLDAQVRPTADGGESAPVGPDGRPTKGPTEATPRSERSAPADDAADEDPLARIEALTGLTKVKQQIRKFTRMVRYNQLREEQGKDGSPMVLHSLFLGNPGTGKTTVARLLGQALHRAGAIPSDTFVEVTGRADLVGDTIGSSAKMTTAVLESARGGVLFIDEAYTLYKPQANEFAQEAVDTILTFMENHRDEIVVLFAGYGEQMQDFIGMNPACARG